MQRYEPTLAEHGGLPSDDPTDVDGWGYFFERTYQGVHSDHLRAIAFVMAFTAAVFLFALLVSLSSADWIAALGWGGALGVFSFFLWATVLTLRRRSRASRRGVRVLSPESSATGS